MQGKEAKENLLLTQSIRNILLLFNYYNDKKRGSKTYQRLKKLQEVKLAILYKIIQQYKIFY